MSQLSLIPQLNLSRIFWNFLALFNFSLFVYQNDLFLMLSISEWSSHAWAWIPVLRSFTVSWKASIFLNSISKICTFLFFSHWNTVYKFMKNQMYVSIYLTLFWNFTVNIFVHVWLWELQEIHMENRAFFPLNITMLQSFLCTRAVELRSCSWGE